MSTVPSPSGSLSNSSTNTVTDTWMSGHGHARVLYPVLAVLNALLILFLYYYVRRMLSGKAADADGTAGAGGDDYETSSAESSPSATSARKDKLSADVLPSLPVFVYAGAGEEALECAVCLAEFSDGERGRLLPRCEHRFHVDCVDVWFQSHSTCPVCRSPAEPKFDPEGDDAV